MTRIRDTLLYRKSYLSGNSLLAVYRSKCLSNADRTLDFDYLHLDIQLITRHYLLTELTVVYAAEQTYLALFSGSESSATAPACAHISTISTPGVTG